MYLQQIKQLKMQTKKLTILISKVYLSDDDYEKSVTNISRYYLGGKRLKIHQLFDQDEIFLIRKSNFSKLSGKKTSLL